MKQCVEKICFWLKNSRIFSLPMTLLSWLVIFVYSLKFNGNIINGLAALVGIACAHLATNLFDDYMDYKKLSANSQKCKCAYIKEGYATLDDVLRVVIIYCGIAFLIGVFLTYRAGFPVIALAFAGGMLTLLYAKLSQVGLSEVAVGLAFGPLLFEGVFYVMTKSFSIEVLFLSLAVVMFTVGLMYVHTILDFEGDMCSHKLTLCCRIGDKNKAIKGVFIVYGLAYLFTLILAYLLNNYWLLITFVLVPLIIKMYKSLNSYTCGGDTKEFYYRLLQARNLMVYFSLMVTLFILL